MQRDASKAGLGCDFARRANPTTPRPRLACALGDSQEWTMQTLFDVLSLYIDPPMLGAAELGPLRRTHFPASFPYFEKL